MNKTTFEVKNGIAVILLNDPDHLNPLDQATDIELLKHLSYCEQSPEVKAVNEFLEKRKVRYSGR